MRVQAFGPLLLPVLLSACREAPKPAPVEVPEAAAPIPVEAGPVDITKCAGCQLAPMAGWTFEGVYADAKCTQPLAQLIAPSCSVIPAVGPTTLTYVDAVGKRKANETTSVTVGPQVLADAPRYRKADKECVKANDGAVDVTPASCTGSRVCRDQVGTLGCTGCRTFTTGCPDFEETRLYAAIDDPGLGATTAGGGGNNLGRLGQCCAALNAEASRLGLSPEAGLLRNAAAQCLAIVRAAGPNSNAPELGVIRGALAGRPVPAVCAGF